MTPRFSEEYYKSHKRAVYVEEEEGVFHSIDTYRLLPRLPLEAECIDSGIGARLCYLRTPGGCELVIIEAGRRVELVNVRVTRPSREEPARLLEECLEGIEGLA